MIPLAIVDGTNTPPQDLEDTHWMGFEADTADVTVISKSVPCISDIPHEIWLSIFQRLNFTELVLSGRVCASFQELARQSLLSSREERSLFRQQSQLVLEGFRIGPIISPVHGDLIVVFKPDGTPELQAWEISTGAIQARCELPPRIRHLYPNEIRISNTGTFVCVHFDMVILLYALNLQTPDSPDFGIHLLRVFRFQPPSRAPTEGDDFHQSTDQDSKVMSAFSNTDEVVSVCRVDRLGRHRTRVTLQYSSIATRLCGYPPRDPYMYPTGTVSTGMNWRTFESPLPWANIQGIDINASPLRVIVPPNLYLKTGFVIRAEQADEVGFLPVEVRGSRIQKLQFSKCGRFLIEANSDKLGASFATTMKWWDLLSGSLSYHFKTFEKRKMIQVLLSKESKFAILVLGRPAYDSCTVHGWNVYNIESGAIIQVERKGYDMFQSYEPHFSISSDAQLIAMVVRKNPLDTDYIAEVYEAATGLQVSSLMCKMHYNPADYYFDNWMSLPGAHGCTHLIGSGDDVSLISFTLCARGVGFTHFK